MAGTPWNGQGEASQRGAPKQDVPRQEEPHQGGVPSYAQPAADEQPQQDGEGRQ